MRRELHYFDIFPKTVPAGESSEITIISTGSHLDFKMGKSCRIMIIPMNENPNTINTASGYTTFFVTANDCKLNFTYEFNNEQEYRIRIFYGQEDNYVMLSVYSLERDLYERIPLRGDLHVHSCFSDGAELPERVAANYRGAGYDFLVISDHENYEGSVRAKRFYENLPINLTIFNGEEVHALDNPIHIVNFGSKKSVQTMTTESGSDYLNYLDKFSDTTEKIVASCRWVCQKIKDTGGLSIFAHPFWITDSYQISLDMTKKLLSERIFDAFELLGGLSPEENMMQRSFYSTIFSDIKYDNSSFSLPIVGSSDSHGTVREPFRGSNLTNPVENEYGYFDYYTIVFSKDNSQESIIDAIINGYTIAVDNIDNKHPNLYGNFRLVSYAIFLLSEYFPLHYQNCSEEGKAMCEYIAKDPDALSALELFYNRPLKTWNKYFGR